MSATETPQSLTDGLHLGGAASDRISFYGATPVVQGAATVTAYEQMATMGLVASGAIDYSVRHKTVSVTAAEIIAMYTTPKALIAAAGAGKSIVITRAVFRIVRSSTAFTGGGAAIIQYNSTANGAGTNACDSTMASTVITGAAGTTETARNGAVLSDVASTAIQNVGIYLSNATAVFAAGTGTATVELWYVVY
jgi:hypothetical protein